jgi:predicted ATPase/DNA-binding winged helix-turn-helix (wHTH) protein
MIHLFGECELDEARFELRRRGAVVKVEPKTFDVLAYLVRSGDRVVSKDELLDALWPGQAVSESVLPKCVAAARRAVGDTRTPGAVIRTVHGRGYRFVAPLRTRIADDAGPAGAAFLSPFVGHAHAMERLRHTLESALAGHGRMALLVGEPGIGKTRTAEELSAEARRRGALVQVGRAYESEGAPAFWPWVQILRGCAAHAAPRRGTRAPDGRELGELIRALDGSAAAGGDASPVEAEHARFRLFDGVAAALKRLAQRQPLLLVLDDLHWADEASLRLLGFLARDLGDARVLILATYRDVELRRGHPLGDLLGSLAREPRCERVALHGFAAEDTAHLIAGVAGAPPPEAVTAAVHEMTDGNPFFIQEVVRLLTSSNPGWMSPGSGDADAGTVPTNGIQMMLALPQSVRDAIGRRLEALSEACNGLLRVAAVLGREFDAPRLARVAEVADARVLERLAEAVQARVLDETEAEPGRYRFHHSLIRQTLYDELSTPERVRLHARAGAALEAARGADVDPVLDELAHHFFQAAAAAESARAIDYCCRAAQRARRLLAYEQSARQYERALHVVELYGPADGAMLAELVLTVGEAHALAGMRDRAGAAFRRAAELARELQRADLLARAALGYRGQGEMGTPVEEAALRLLEEARGALPETQAALRARLLSRLVGTPPYSDSLAARESMSREAVELARVAGDSAALRDALEARLWACLGPDHLDERLAVARDLLELAKSQHNLYMALLAHEAELGTHLICGDLGAADRALANFSRVAETLRQPALSFFATFYRGSRALAAGELDEAERLFRAALARGKGTVPYAHFMCTAQLYVLQYMRGAADDPELHGVFFGEMLAMPYSWEPAMRSALAFSHYVRGDREAARREFEAIAGRGFDAIRRDEHWLVTMGSLSSMAVMLGDRGRAEQLYDLLSPYAGLVFVHDLLRSVGGTVASALGSLAALLGRSDEGERHYQHAHAKETAMGGITAFMDRPGYARLLLMRDRPGDRAEAAAVLAHVRGEMARLGIARNWQLIAIEDLGLMPADPPPAPPPARRGQRNVTKPSRVRQDSGGG